MPRNYIGEAREENINRIMNIANSILGIVSKVKQREAATQLNSAGVEVSRRYFDFFE